MALKLNMGATKNTNTNDREQADLWLNIGYTAEGNDGEAVFVGLPMGLPLDTMKEQPLRGSNEEYRQLVQAKNALLTQLIEAAGEIAPGEEEFVNLQVQIRRRAVAAEPSANNNPLMGGLVNLSLAKAS